MVDREQPVTSETAVREVFENQFPTLTNQLLYNMRQVSLLGDKWPPILMVLLGAALAFIPVLITTGLLGGTATAELNYMEFITLVIAGAGLIFFGALFSLFQGWSLRRIVMAQQIVGTEILHKQIDIEKDMIRERQKQQGQLILLPAKRLRRLRCR
jgi:hypothetical protein